MEQVGTTELLLTVKDLAVRWGRSVGAIYAARSRGNLPAADYLIDNKPLWKEATIRQAEANRPDLYKS